MIKLMIKLLLCTRKHVWQIAFTKMTNFYVFKFCGLKATFKCCSVKCSTHVGKWWMTFAICMC